MDKKIYIDGVDVSGCKHYRAEIETKMPYGEYEILKDKCHYSGIEIIQDCKGNKGCIYKQLKRLQHYQAEFEHELMNDYTYDGYISPNGFTPIDVIKHIKSELKRLQAENEQLTKSIDRIMQEKEIKTINLDIAKENAELKAECERLKEEKQELSIEIVSLTSKLFTLEKSSNDLSQSTNKLYKALQEIREIVLLDSSLSRSDTKANIISMYDNIETIILAKINEVIGAE